MLNQYKQIHLNILNIPKYNNNNKC